MCRAPSSIRTPLEEGTSWQRCVWSRPSRRQHVKHVEVDVPEPGHDQVLLQMKASSICGSDIRAIYREHLGTGLEAYQGMIAGHEPSGEVVAVGPGCRRLSVGDRVVVYHIAGCGVCEECRHGYMIGCTFPLRAADGWRRYGGHPEFPLAAEATCILLPDELSYVGGRANTPHLHPLAHGATAMPRSLTRRPARVV
jgi:D-arabinose 1-dehydrogenase-like Zn-dependent alcohol dehydrogenase